MRRSKTRSPLKRGLSEQADDKKIALETKKQILELLKKEINNDNHAFNKEFLTAKKMLRSLKASLEEAEATASDLKLQIDFLKKLLKDPELVTEERKARLDELLVEFKHLESIIYQLKPKIAPLEKVKNIGEHITKLESDIGQLETEINALKSAALPTATLMSICFTTFFATRKDPVDASACPATNQKATPT